MEYATGNTLGRAVGLNADRLKAFLLIVVLADHNDWFRVLAPKLFEPLTFHVLGFFLLLFTFGNKEWSLDFVADRVARYLVPYWWALTGATLAFSVMYGRAGSPVSSGVSWLLAAVIGNAPFVKQASGFLMLWFLPSLFGLSLLLSVHDSCRSLGSRRTVLAVVVIAHLVVPMLPTFWLHRVPFGLAIGMSVFAVGLVWRRLLPVSLPKYWGVVSTGVHIVSYGFLVSTSTHLEIATLDLAGIASPLTLLLQDVAGISGVLMSVWLVGFLRNLVWLDAIGKNSLLIYLLHPVVYVVLGKVWPYAPSGGTEPIVLLVSGIATAVVALAVASGIAIVLKKSALFERWVIPRSWRQWPPSAFLLRAGGYGKAD